MLWLAVLALIPGDAVSVPGGTARIGSDAQPDNPAREVELAPYGLDATEVDIASFEAFVAAGGFRERSHWSDEGWAWAQANPEGAGAELRAAGRSGEHPVVAVTFWEAEAYCAWKGGRLPTEVEWERAACGGASEPYPWGASQDVDAVWYASGKYGQLDSVRTQPVDQGAAHHGLKHMAGNVWEWTASSYDEGGTWATLRGGSFMNLPSYCTCQHREPARRDRVAFTTGFRCAWSP